MDNRTNPDDKNHFLIHRDPKETKGPSEPV